MLRPCDRKDSCQFRIKWLYGQLKVLEWISYLRLSQRRKHLTSGTCPFACLYLWLPYPLLGYDWPSPATCLSLVYLKPSFLPFFPWCTLHCTQALVSSWTDHFLLPYHYHPCVCPQCFPPFTDHCCSSSQLSLSLPVSCVLIHSTANSLFPKSIIMENLII